MPARAKPAADALDLTPTPDARGDLRRLPSAVPADSTCRLCIMWQMTAAVGLAVE